MRRDISVIAEYDYRFKSSLIHFRIVYWIAYIYHYINIKFVSKIFHDINKKRLCYAKPVKIGNGCWLGANVTVCSGVTIGNGCVIGAGSVVTRNIADNTFAAGVPCKEIRKITEEDSMKYKPEILGESKVK